MSFEMDPDPVYSRVISKENMRMWGKLYLGRWEKAICGWVVDSWAENGAPYWQPRLNWFDGKENKLLKVVNFDFGGRQRVEDTDIEPERAKFIRETIEQWEKDWLQKQEAKRT